MGALNRLAFTTNVLQSSLVAAEEKSVEPAVESQLAKLRDATAEADYVLSEHLPGPLQVRGKRTLDQSVVLVGLGGL